MKRIGLLLLLVTVAVLCVNLSTAQGPRDHPPPNQKDQSPDGRGPDGRGPGRQVVKRAAQMNADNMPMPKMPSPSDFQGAGTKMGSMFSGAKRRFVRSPQGSETPQLMFAGEAPSDDAEGEDGGSQGPGPHGHFHGHGPHGHPHFKHGPPCSKGMPEDEQNENE